VLAFAPVTLTAEETELMQLLRTKGLSIRNLDPAKKGELRVLLHDLHVVRGMSLTDIAKLVGNKTSGYTSWLCRQLGVEARPFEEARLKGIREKRRKYERKPFDGTEQERAYLIGMRQGDLSASKPWKGVVRVSTSTTHPAMAELFRSLFEPHGHIYQHARFKKDTKSFEWNLSTIVDESFDFLIGERDSQLSTFIRDDVIPDYLAGILGAEGSIGIFENSGHTSIIISIYNTDLGLLNFVKTSLVKMGCHVLGPYLDKKRGTRTSKYQIERMKDYWRIAVATFEDCQRLLRQLPLRHREKQARKELALSVEKGQLWDRVKGEVEGIRNRVRMERDEFVGLAETKYFERNARPTARA
jgi:hypothetical protein